MSALDDLVKSLQAAAAFGREDDVMQVDALRSDIDQQSGALAATKQELDELLQRAAALQGGN